MRYPPPSSTSIHSIINASINLYRPQNNVVHLLSSPAQSSASPWFSGGSGSVGHLGLQRNHGWERSVWNQRPHVPSAAARHPLWTATRFDFFSVVSGGLCPVIYICVPFVGEQYCWPVPSLELDRIRCVCVARCRHSRGRGQILGQETRTTKCHAGSRCKPSLPLIFVYLFIWSILKATTYSSAYPSLIFHLHVLYFFHVFLLLFLSAEF